MVCGHTYQESGHPRLWHKTIFIDTLNPSTGEGALTALDISKGAF